MASQWFVLCKGFGADRKYEQVFLNAQHDLQPELTHYQTLLGSMVQGTQLHLPNLVTFSHGAIDQNIWERSSNAELVQGGGVTVDLFALIRAFVGHMTFPSLLGSDFLDVYPGVFEDLYDVDSSLKYLLVGLPRWSPIQSLAKANIARHRLDNAIDSFHKALDKAALGDIPGPPWRDLSDVSQVMKTRSAIWRKHNLPPAVRGPLDLHLLWM